ncbi:MAG: DNA/RNA non-specific endonuclease [Opitutales bacterium]
MAATVFALIGVAGFRIWFSQQDDQTQEKVAQQGVSALEWLRDQDATPEEADRAIDWMITIIPQSQGVLVDPEAFGDERFAIGGLPVSDRRLKILENTAFIVGYDEEMRNPAWVAYRLTYTPGGTTAERPDDFDVDRRTRARVDHDDYTHSGYDRGHMAPNYAIGVVYGPQAQFETFLMSNIVPQSPGLNRGLWRLLEEEVARDWLPDYRELWIISGPVYEEPVRRLPSGVAIPDAFFKIVVDLTDSGELRMVSVVVPQEAEDFSEASRFLVSIDEIEDATGLDFMSLLADETEDQVEAEGPRRLW